MIYETSISFLCERADVALIIPFILLSSRMTPTVGSEGSKSSHNCSGKEAIKQ